MIRRPADPPVQSTAFHPATPALVHAQAASPSRQPVPPGLPPPRAAGSPVASGAAPRQPLPVSHSSGADRAEGTPGSNPSLRKEEASSLSMQGARLSDLPDETLDLVGRKLASHADRASLSVVDKYTHTVLAPQLEVPRHEAAVQQARSLMEFREAITALSRLGRQDPGRALQPEQQSEQVAALQAAAKSAGKLPALEQPFFFEIAREIAPDLPQPHGEALRIGLLEQLHLLTEGGSMATEIHAGLAWAKELPEARRGGPLAALSRGICHFPNPGGRKLMMEWVCEATAKLSPEYREEPMAALRELVHHLPEDQRQAASERISSLGKSAEDGTPAAAPQSGGT